MKILAIETSCDETAISILEAKGELNPPANIVSAPHFKILSNVVSSQIKLHAKWGGVVPNLARREHEKNIIPVFRKALKEAKMFNTVSKSKVTPWKPVQDVTLEKILHREPELLKQFLKEIPKIKIPKIDAIAVTYGPGLEPALWVGINFAKAIAFAWKKPLVPVNHMEGHIIASLLNGKSNPPNGGQNAKLIKFPSIALLVSGGHTELVLMKKWLNYKIIGQTRDDAVGEAFDKVARMLELGYPGGPIVAKLASLESQNSESEIKLPRPMLASGDFDFSFSGLKTAVLYLIKNLKENKDNVLDEATIADICREFQQAAIDVLVSKTINATKKYKAKTIIIGGGVAANKELRNQFAEAIEKESSYQTDSKTGLSLLIPDLNFTTDNASMIAAVAYLRINGAKNSIIKDISKLKADGNLILK